MLLLSVSVGLLAGLAAKILETAVQFGVQGVIGRFADPGSTAMLRFRWETLLLPSLGGLISGIIVGSFCRPTRAHGTAVLIDAFHHEGADLPLRDSLLRAMAATAVIACGGSVGKEAPIAVLGAAIGTTLPGAFRMTPRERRLYLIAGCAAGVGAIFQCPLGGALFATTVLYREPEIEGDALMPSLIASVTSYSIFMAFGGYGHRLLGGIENLAFKHPRELVPYAVLAVFCALVGFFFHHCLHGAPTLFRKYRIPKWTAPAVAGLFVGALACVLPQVMDARYAFVQRTLDGQHLAIEHSWLWWGVILTGIVMAKCLATALMIGADTAGGLFGPVIFMGGLAGAGAGAFLEAAFPGRFPETLRQALIPVGMAGLLSATLRTPLAAIVMVMEMTGSYGLIVPLMFVSTLSYALGRKWGVYAEQVSGPDDSPAHAGESLISTLEFLTVGDLMDRPWPYVTEPRKTFRDLVSSIGRGTRPTFAVVEERRLVGIIPTANIANFTDVGGSGHGILAADLMTADSTVVHPYDDLYGTIALFRHHDDNVLPVVEGKNRRFVGMLTRRAILKVLRERLDKQRSHILREHSGFSALANENLLEGLLSELSSHRGAWVRRMSVPDEVVGTSLSESDFRRRYHCQVIGIETGSGELLSPPDPQRILLKDDVLIVLANVGEDGA